MHPSGYIALIISLVVAYLAFRQNTNMQEYWSRACTGREWKKRFKHESKHAIRSFLYIFVDSYGLTRNKILYFHPDDKIMDIYCSIYPQPQNELSGDALECESLIDEFKIHYGIDPTPYWSADITLGELFTLTGARLTNPSTTPASPARTQPPAAAGPVM